jgi:hypothetical protein
MSRGKRCRAFLKVYADHEPLDESEAIFHMKDINVLPPHYTGRVIVDLETGAWISDCVERVDLWLRPGMELWLKDGLAHRDGDLPALIGPDQDELWWCQHGKRHRENDKPAVVTTSGAEYWHA